MTDKAAHAAGTRGARHQRSRSGASERIKRITDLVNLDLDARVRLLEEMTRRQVIP